jgi:hypothetical protein
VLSRRMCSRACWDDLGCLRPHVPLLIKSGELRTGRICTAGVQTDQSASNGRQCNVAGLADWVEVKGSHGHAVSGEIISHRKVSRRNSCGSSLCVPSTSCIRMKSKGLFSGGTKGCLRSNPIPLPLGSKARWELLVPALFAVSRQDSRCFRHSCLPRHSTGP